MKVLKREIIYTCEIEWIDTNNVKQKNEIECNNKGILKRVSGIIGCDNWTKLEKEVKRQFRKKN